MGRLKNGINGPVYGKVGNVVGASCRGVDYVRKAAGKSTKPATPAQQIQRDKFALVVGWLKPLLDIINLGYQVFQGDKTPLNLALSYHLKEAVKGEAPDFSIDFKKAVFSKGELLISWIIEVLVLVDRIIHIKWDNLPATPFNNDSDKATFIVYNPAREQFVTFEDIAIRNDKEARIQLPDSFSTDKVHCWMSYANAARDKVSTSVYLGELLIS
ncbi:DUF6266 family protein [Pedobacter sp. PWIIR3]